MLKQDILNEFELNREQLLSGQQLANQFHVSRNAVWKSIAALRQEGHQIESVPNRGYRLSLESDVLSESGIRKWLSDSSFPELEFAIFQTVDSTNNEAKRYLAVHTHTRSAIIAAEAQTEGRGRRGHSFYSPHGNGLYFSVILQPRLLMGDAFLVTAAAAVAVVQTIKKLTGYQTGIKWVNDIFFHGKKICGILTEAITDLESGQISSVIVGIGINLNVQKFPDELSETAGSLHIKGIDRNQFIAEIYLTLSNFFDHLEEKTFLQDYRRFSLVIGHQILYQSNGQPCREAIVQAIHDDGGLEVKTEKQEVTLLHSNETSILQVIR